MIINLDDGALLLMELCHRVTIISTLIPGEFSVIRIVSFVI